LAIAATREQEVGHVHTRDQEHAGYGTQQHPERALRFADDLLVQGNDGHAGTVVLRVSPRLGGGDTVHFRLSLSRIDSGSEPPHDRQIMIGTLARVQRQREPCLCLPREAEARRHDPDHGMRLPAQGDRASDEALLRPEPPPQSIAEDYDLASAALLVLDEEPAAETRLDAEGREEVRGHADAGDGSRFTLDDQPHRTGADRREVLERPGQASPVGEMARGYHYPLVAPRLPSLPHHDEALGARERQRPQQDRPHDAEDGRGRTDPQGHRHHHDRRRPRSLQRGS